MMVLRAMQAILLESLTRRASRLASDGLRAWRAQTQLQSDRKDQLRLCVGRIIAVKQRSLLLAWFAVASKRALLRRKLGNFVW